MSIFENLVVYPEKWSLKESRSFTQAEIDAVSQAVVVDSQFGLSVKFFMVNGGSTYIPLDPNSNSGMGEEVDLTKAKLLTLSKTGEGDIFRVSI